MKRIAIFIFFIFLIFVSSPYIILPLLFVAALLFHFVFYEIIFFGILMDIVSVSPFPIYTILVLIILALSFFIRKRMSFHV